MGSLTLCRIADVFLTVNSDNCDTYKLTQLVTQFNLSDSLVK